MTSIMIYILFAAGNFCSVITAREKGWKIAHLIVALFCTGMVINFFIEGGNING